jgi:hypothetical protein
MGIRDPRCFNKAKFAKQIWILISKPESLCARVLRRKYYPDGRILEAKLEKGSSFTWQIIIARLQAFKKDPSGESEMEVILIYGMIPGCP